MAILSALAAISAIAFQGGTLTLGGKVVQINYPTPAVRQVPEDVKTWDGFGSLPAGLREWPTPFQAPGDWSSITAKLAELGPVAKDAPQWKTKIFLVTQTDSAIQDQNGLFTQRRSRLDSKNLDDTLRAIARVPGYVRAVTNGAVNVHLDVEVDGEPMVLEPKLSFDGKGFVLQSLGSQFDGYAAARTNRGSFLAEDKVFRGPYQTVLVLDAGSLYQPLSRELDAYGVEELITRAIVTQSADRWYSMGIYKAPSAGSVSASMPLFHPLAGRFPAKVWEALQSSEEPSFEKLQELYGLAEQTFGSEENAIEFPWRPAPYSGNVAVSIFNDEQRGTVLRYAENSPVRSGGFALPYRNVDVAKTPFLSFWVKTGSRDNLVLRAEDNSSKAKFPIRREIPVQHNGAWQQVVIDLRSASPRTVQELYIGPSGDGQDRDQVGDILYFFDDFQLLGEGQATPALPDPHEELVKRAKAANLISAKELEKETSDFVKLNGLLRRETPYEATDEAALINLTKSVNARVAGESVKKLAQLGTPSARSEVLRLVTASPFEYARQVAALEVGKFGDPKLAGLLSRLFASRFWQTRLAGALAVASIPGDEAAVISMTYLQETDPVIRLALTQKANVQNSVVQKRLLWSTVNDPSDSVRAESAWRLITSGKENLAAEGYKAIRDDSNWVRIDLLNRMGLNPAETHRPALRMAITDLSPRVRAATLAAFAKLPGEVSLDEVANVLQDKFPVVQLALIQLAKAKKLTLPSESLANLRASIDLRVVEQVKELGQ